MMLEFEVDLQKPRKSAPDEPVGLAIRSRGTVFTRLRRPGEDAPQDHLQAPAGQLAFWLVDNWWRLRHECVPAAGQTSEWRLAHDLSSIGSYAWPRLTIWGEGDLIRLQSKSDPSGVVGPVRYLTNALTFVSATVFEDEVDRFLDQVAAENTGLASDWAALRAQIETLIAERSDPNFSSWRQLEAQLGYDIDEAPETLMAALEVLQLEYGVAGVAEAALGNQGDNAATVLVNEIAAAKDHHFKCELGKIAALIGSIRKLPGDEPWQFGERAAAAVRRAVGHPGGPLSDSDLADILHVQVSAFDEAPATGARKPPYGLRLITGARQDEIVSIWSGWKTSRRFGFCRALGDAIWSKNDRLGPLTQAASERQKFQRAFAQSLLIPFEDLESWIGDDYSDGALTSAALHFEVSHQVVRTLLVNKGKLDRERLIDSEAA